MTHQPERCNSSSQWDKPQKLSATENEIAGELSKGDRVLPGFVKDLFTDDLVAAKPEHETASDLHQDGRQILLSDHNLNRLASYSERARNNTSHVTEHPKEFTSYFHGNNTSRLPVLLVTSHEDSRKPIYSLYPSMVEQSLRWKKCIELGAFKDIEPQESTCRCTGCTDVKCPYRNSSATALKNSIFKANIMTFNDQYTMTPKVNDVSCGICLGIQRPQTRSVDISTTSSYNVDQECTPQFLMRISNMQPQERRSPPILKRHDSERDRRKYFARNERYGIERYGTDSCELCDHRQHYSSDPIEEEDSDEAYYNDFKPKKCSSPYKYQDYYSHKDVEVPPKICKPRMPTLPRNRSRRIMLYNEGISDSVASNFEPSFMNTSRKPSPLELGIGRQYMDEDYPENSIPFSHRGKSRYHHDCKRSPDQTYRAEVEEGQMEYSPQFSPRVPPRLPRRPSPPSSRTNCGLVPKKLLISERNINAYMSTNEVKYSLKHTDGCK